MLLEMTLAALVLIGGATAFIFGLAGSLPDERKVKREIATKRVMRISSLIDGAPAAIRGNVVAGREGLVTAPISGRPCVYWMVVEGKRHGKSGGHAFVVEDGTGTARVVPIDARLAVPSVRQEADDGAVEYAILPGTTITVVGWCTFETNPDAVAEVTGYRKELPTRPVVSGTRRQRLLIA